MGWWKALTGVGRAFVSLAAIICLLIVILSVMAYRQKQDDKRDQAGREAVTEGRTQSAAEAISEIGKLGERADATDDEVRQAMESVRDASPEDRASVFRYRACLLQHRTDCSRLQSIS